jgi:hypothetical protein
MWLADAVGAYVERLTEREFDAPFIALLHHLGYSDIHLTHGQYEYGKDFIARKSDGGQVYQWCFQTKAGDISSKQLRQEVQPQINLMRVGTFVHPAFDKDLPRRIVVVTTGRLIGSAGTEFQQTEDYHRDRGEVSAELWDIDTVVPDLVSTLVTRQDLGTQARLLEMVGRLQGMRGSRADVAALAVGWLAPGDSDKNNWRDVLTACLLASTAAQAGREDLAQQATWQIVRAYHRAVERGESPAAAILDVAHCAFDAVAVDVWEQIRVADDPVEVTSRATSAVAAFLVHPIKVARLCEILSMLALTRIDVGNAVEAAELLDFIDDLIQSTSALSHPVGEEWMFSILATAVALAAGGHLDAANRLVERTAIWLLDWTENGLLLPPAGAPPSSVVGRMLATAYEPPRAPGSKAMYSFAVVADLAALLMEAAPVKGEDNGDHQGNQGGDIDTPNGSDLLADIINDLHALRAMATLKVPTGIEKCNAIARVDYSTTAPIATHHKPESAANWPISSWLESLEIWGTFRDRHLPTVLAAAMGATSTPSEPMDAT